MKKIFIKKWFFVFLFFVFLPGVVYSEQYEAIPLKGRSLLYLNSFGIFNDDYEYIIIPRLISYLPGKRLITNLTNLNGENTFQIAHFHRLGFNNAVVFSFTGSHSSQDSLLSTYTQTFTDELYNDGVNDTLLTVEEDKAEDEYGNPFPYRESLYMEFYAGYGHIISEKLRAGGGFSYIRDSSDEDYNGIEIGGTSFGLYNFGTSSLRRRVEETYDLIDEHLIARTEENEDGTIERVKDRYFLFGGVDFLPGKGWRLSLDILLSYGKFSSRGKGIYTKESQVGSAEVYAEGFTSVNSLSSYLLTIGTAIEIEKKAGSHRFVLDVGYERTPGNVDSGKIEEEYSSVGSPNISDLLKKEEKAVGEYSSGRMGAVTLFSISVRGMYEGWERLKFGYGMEYVRRKDRSEKGRIDYTYTLTEVYDDGDSLTEGDPDDYTLTAQAGKSVVVNSYVFTEHLAFPLFLMIDAGKGFQVLLGARYRVERVKKSSEVKYVSASYYQEEKVYGDGRREFSTTIPSTMEGVWPDTNTELKGTSSVTNEVNSITDLRAGIMYKGIRNLSLSIMVDTGIGDGIRGRVDLSGVFFSAILKF